MANGVPILHQVKNQEKMMAKAFSPLESQLKALQKVIGSQIKATSTYEDIAKEDRELSKQFWEAQQQRRQKVLDTLKNKTEQEFSNLISHKNELNTLEGKRKLQEIVFLKKRIAFQATLEQKQIELQDRREEIENRRKELLESQSKQAKADKREKIKRNIGRGIFDKFSEGIIGTLTKPLGFLEKLGGFNILESYKERKANKRELKDLERQDLEERRKLAKEGMELGLFPQPRENLTDQERIANAKNITPKESKLGVFKPPKLNLSPKRSTILRPFPQFVYLGDTIREQLEKSDKKKKKEGGKKGFLAGLGKFGKFLPGIILGGIGLVKTIEDVSFGLKEFKGSTSNTVATGIAGKPFKDAQKRMQKQALKYGALGAGIGTLFGPLGTAIGGGLGLVIGGVIGELGPERIAKAIQFVLGKHIDDVRTEIDFWTRVQSDPKKLKELGYTPKEIAEKLKEKRMDAIKLLKKGGETGFLGNFFVSELTEVRKSVNFINTELKKSDDEIKQTYGLTREEFLSLQQKQIKRRKELIKQELSLQSFLGSPDDMLKAEYELIKLQDKLKKSKLSNEERRKLEDKKTDIELTIDSLKLQQQKDKLKSLEEDRKIILGEGSFFLNTKEIRTKNLQEIEKLRGNINQLEKSTTEKVYQSPSVKKVFGNVQQPTFGPQPPTNIQQPIVHQTSNDAVIRGRDVFPFSYQDKVILTKDENLVDFETGENFSKKKLETPPTEMALRELKDVLLEIFQTLKSIKNTGVGGNRTQGNNVVPVESESQQYKRGLASFLQSL